MITRLCLLIALLCALAPAPQVAQTAPPQPITRAVHVVLVEPPGEAYDATRAGAALVAIQDAAAFWHGYAAPQIVSTTIISPAIDVYSDLSWSLAYVQPDAADVTIFILDNTRSNKRLPGGDVGDEQDYYGIIWVCQFGDVLPAVLSHEFGHVLFALPDWYRVPGACDHIDIMCGHVAAYQQGFIGCRTLAFLGAPCRQIVLPAVLR